MKKLLLFVCVVLVLLCGCKGGNPLNQKTFENDSAQAVWDGYHNRIAEAASSDTLTYIRMNEFIITDKTMIGRWLATLQENKPTDIIKQDDLIGDRVINLSFGYPDKEVSLGAFHSIQIDVYYSRRWNERGYWEQDEYCLEIPYDNGMKIIELAIECGFDPLPRPY